MNTSQCKRREKIKRFLDNSSHLRNRELIREVDDPGARSVLGLTTEPFEFIEQVEVHIESTIGRLVSTAEKCWPEELPSNLDVRVVLNYRDPPKGGRSNAATRTGRWRSQCENKLRDAGACINLNSVWASLNSGIFHEYAHIRYDPQIGSIITPTWRAYLEVLLCHEFAHILEMYVREVPGEFPHWTKGKRCRGHDYNWQTIYRKLRFAFGHVESNAADAAAISKQALVERCEYCGEAFTPTRRGTKFCSTKCRVYSSRNRNGR